MDHNVSSPNFGGISEKLDTWHVIQVCSFERAKNQQLLVKLSIHLAHQNLVKFVALQRRHINIL
jgi:hypothetical protein